jgi:imidazole glycerol phosphate synthase subunit HisF
MSKIKYDKNLLQEICNRDKCIIDFDKIKKYNRDIKIEFICNCGIKNIKTFRCIYEGGGGYCKICTENIRQEKVKNTCLDKYGVENTLIHLENIRYTKELLEIICSRDKCIINFDKIKAFVKVVSFVMSPVF